MLKKLTSLFLSFVIFVTVVINPLSVYAQTSWYNSSFPDWYDKVYNEESTPASEIFGERYTAGQVQWILYSLLSSFLHSPYFVLSLFGVKTPSPYPYTCVFKLMGGEIDEKTCVAAAVSNLTTMYEIFDRVGVVNDNTNENSLAYIWRQVFSSNREISFISYSTNLIKKFNPVKEAYAQQSNGFGYGKLLPISGYWQLTRNFSYILFVLIIIVSAFMIMFKVKISSQASITIQSLIPRIATSLILITFSLAIAGLLMDLMYVVFGLLASALPTMGSNDLNFEDTYNFLIGGFWGWASKDGLSGIFITFLFYLVSYFAISMTTVAGSIVVGNLTSFVFSVLMVFFTVIMIFILIYNLLKMIFNLVKTVALIYLAVVTAPLQIMMDVLPPPLGGSNFKKWITGLVSKLLVFPLTGLLIFFSFKLLGTAWNIAISQIDSTYNTQGVSQSMFNACQQMSGTANNCNFFFNGNLGANGATYWGAPWLGNAGAMTAVVFLLMSAMCIMTVANVPKIIEGALSGRLDLESIINEPIKVGGTTAVGLLKEGKIKFPYSTTVGSTLEAFIKTLR